MSKMFFNNFIIFVAFQLLSLVHANEKCEKMAETVELIYKCCAFPLMASKESIGSAYEAVSKSGKANAKNIQCLITAKVFEELKLTQFDKAAFKSYVPTAVQDPEWVALYENTTEYCIDNLAPHEEFYSKVTKVTKEECDVRYVAFVDCMIASSFKTCPAKSFTDKPACHETKAFMNECYHDEKSMLIYAKKQIEMKKP